MVRRYRREDITFWGSMFAQQHATVQRLNPNVSCFYSGKQVAKTYFWWIFGCLWCCSLPSDAFMTTHMTKRQMKFMKGELERRNRTCCCWGFLLQVIRLVHNCSKGLYRHLKARNVTTIIWVVNH